MKPADDSRYERQISLPEIGKAGQELLKKARVTVVGAGGLGSPVCFYLAAAGIGSVTLIDADTVDVTNLNRQILHWEKDLGRPKVESALEKLRGLNSSIAWRGLHLRLETENAIRLIEGSDLIFDCLDNFETRYVLNEAALKIRVPLIHGACRGMEGRVSLIVPGKTPCLRCFIPEPPPAEKFPVIGFTPGIIGLFQVAEAIKYLLKLPCTLTGKLLIYDGQRLFHRIVDLEKDPDCPVCGTK